jgi:hypothetical protein
MVSHALKALKAIKNNFRIRLGRSRTIRYENPRCSRKSLPTEKQISRQS